MGYLGKGPGIRTVLLITHKSVGWSYVRTLFMSNPLRIYCARYLECLARLDVRHGLGVLRALGGVIDLGVAQRQRDRAMAHELFHHCERGPGIEELRRKGMPQGMGRIGLSNSCPLEILRHAPLDGTDTHGRSWEGGTRKQHGHGRPLSSPPLAQHLLQIRRDVHDSIDASFAVVHPESALGPIDGRPGEARDLAHAKATPQHEQKHGAIPDPSLTVARYMILRL